MASSFPLTAYLAISARPASQAQDFSITRPAGCVIWLHCAENARLATLLELGQKLANRLGASVLVTLPKETLLPEMPTSDAIFVHLPSEHPEDIKRFLHHWTPDMAIWMDQTLRPALLRAARLAKIALFLIDADQPKIKSQGLRAMFPAPVNATLGLFDHILTRHAPAVERFTWLLRASQTHVSYGGHLRRDHPVPSCNSDDLTTLSEALVARACWLAAFVQMDELDLILKSQRGISRLSPRIVLILVPADATDAPEIFRRCRSEGFNIAHWDEGEFPSEKTDILLAENSAELGLFYRIAPITLMASSLVAGQSGRNPFDAAALGSAVLYGGHVKDHQGAYQRLAEAEAARLVKDAPTVVDTLEELMAADRVATMVHAGWDTVSQGAGVTRKIADEICNTLARKETAT